MVTRDLPELPPEWAMDLHEESEFIQVELARLTEAIEGLVEADSLLQKEIANLKSYNDLLWNKVIKKFHPDAQLVDMAVPVTDKLADLISKNRGKLTVVSNNLNSLKNRTDEIKAKIRRG